MDAAWEATESSDSVANETHDLKHHTVLYRYNIKDDILLSILKSHCCIRAIIYLKSSGHFKIPLLELLFIWLHCFGVSCCVLEICCRNVCLLSNTIELNFCQIWRNIKIFKKTPNSTALFLFRNRDQVTQVNPQTLVWAFHVGKTVLFCTQGGSAHPPYGWEASQLW